MGIFLVMELVPDLAGVETSHGGFRTLRERRKACETLRTLQLTATGDVFLLALLVLCWSWTACTRHYRLLRALAASHTASQPNNQEDEPIVNKK